MDMDRGIITGPAMDILPMAIDRTARAITVHTAIHATDITRKDGIMAGGIPSATTENTAATDMPVIITGVIGHTAVTAVVGITATTTKV